MAIKPDYLNTKDMATVIEGIKFYTIPETAEALRVTPQTIRAWIKQGKIKSQRIGRPILITENNLKEFLQNGE
jgi:excisionase family DNA binding protein